MSAEALTTPTVALRAVDYVDLTKPRITFMVGITTLAGFLLAVPSTFSPWLLVHTLLGTALVGSGASVLNQVLEWRRDALMRRTAQRPIPAGRMDTTRATVFGGAISALGVAELLVFANPLAAGLGALSWVLYVFCYTPLKTRISLATIVGAVPGALPPVMGCAAASNEVSPLALALFALLFLWQMPHSLAIAWLYRDDYARGGYRLLTVDDPTGERTSRQIILWASALLPVSLLPNVLGASGLTYMVGALAVGLAFLATTFSFALTHDDPAARRVVLTSVAYLPVVLLLMVVDSLVG